jgi:uncharacterized membrane protein YeaQ/YmgE (transglycosylase-associated protein family)
MAETTSKEIALIPLPALFRHYLATGFLDIEAAFGIRCRDLKHWPREESMFLLYIVIVGLVAGWAAGKIMKGSGYGPIVDILLGIAGAIIGSRLLGLLGIYTSGGLVPNILVAILGAVILVLIVRAIKRT